MGKIVDAVEEEPVRMLEYEELPVDGEDDLPKDNPYEEMEGNQRLAPLRRRTRTP